MNWLSHLGFIRTELAVNFTADMFDLDFPREEHHHQKQAYKDIISLKSCSWRGILVNCWVTGGLPSGGKQTSPCGCGSNSGNDKRGIRHQSKGEAGVKVKGPC